TSASASATASASAAASASASASASVPAMEVQVRSAGATSAPAFAFVPDGGPENIRIPALFAWFEHPDHGTVVFDTGYSPRFVTATQPFPQRLYRWLTPCHCTWQDTAAAHLQRANIDPHQVRWVVLSHFDPDHYGGLLDFPNATFVLTAEAWLAARPHLYT